MSLTKQDKQDIQEIVDTTVNKAVGDLAEVVSEFATSVDSRFNSVDARLDELSEEIRSLKRDVNSILNRLDSIEADIQLNDQERAVMGMQLTRLHDWVEKAAAKVGVEFTH